MSKNRQRNRAEQRAARALKEQEGLSYAQALERLRAQEVFVSDDQLIRGRVRVDWADLGEGWDGDYDPEDPEDEALLRFDFYAHLNGEWVAVNDTSYCTQVPADTDPNVRRRLLTALMDTLGGYIEEGLREHLSRCSSEQEAFDRQIELYPSQRRAFEQASWISPSAVA